MLEKNTIASLKYFSRIIWQNLGHVNAYFKSFRVIIYFQYKIQLKLTLWGYFFVFFPEEYKVAIFWERENMKGAGVEKESFFLN